MQSLTISYFKRYRMEIHLADARPPDWPGGYRPVPWRPDLLDTHAEILARSFLGERDAQLFPSLGSVEGCRALMSEVVRRRFVPESTWLIDGPDGPCGSIQAILDRPGLAAIQNIAVLPRLRGLGLGRALVLHALRAMYNAGLGRAMLEVTAQNHVAIGLYGRLGFRRTRVLYKAVSALPATYLAEPTATFSI